mmetsp:Transcript_25668/g.22787  ORF Transcript_25668/g.22787 Transcript_25668/m.22787 type:complete len:121 (+) Transcript_25668:18-380(+)
MPFTVADGEKSELAVVFASLILHDDGAAITDENITKILGAANVKVEPYWPKLFASLLEGKDVAELLLNAGSGGSDSGSGGSSSGGSGDSAAAVEEEEEEEEESEDEDEEPQESAFSSPSF